MTTAPKDTLDGYEGLGTDSTLKAEKIGPWRIWFDPPPIGTRVCDWHYQHEETDLDCPSWMNGSCPSREACIAEIIEGYEDRAELAATIIRQQSAALARKDAALRDDLAIVQAEHDRWIAEATKHPSHSENRARDMARAIVCDRIGAKIEARQALETKDDGAAS